MMKQEDAARWFATLRRGVMTVDERAAYHAWMADSANQAALERLQNLWAGLEEVRDYVAPASRPAPARRRSRFSESLQVAAVVGTFLLGVGVMYTTDTSHWTTLDWADR